MQVWVCIAAATLAIGPVVWVVMRSSGIVLPLHVTSFNMFRSFVVQTNFLPPRSTSLRFVFLFWYFFCYIIYGEWRISLFLPSSFPPFLSCVCSFTHVLLFFPSYVWIALCCHC